MKLPGRTLKMIKWVLEAPRKRRFILVPNQKRKNQIVAYAKSIGIEIEKQVIVADRIQGLMSEETS